MSGCCLEWISMFKQTAFFRHYMQFIVFKTCLFTKFVRAELKENEPTWDGQAEMEHLISCSLWEPLRHGDASGSTILRVY